MGLIHATNERIFFLFDDNSLPITPVMQPEHDSEFWRDMPLYIYVGLTESDEELFGTTVRTAASFLQKCRASGLPWPRETSFDGSCMYLVWTGQPHDTEIQIHDNSLYIDQLYAIEPAASMMHVVTHIGQYTTQPVEAAVVVANNA